MEEESGIGGKMVRTTEKSGDKQRAEEKRKELILEGVRAEMEIDQEQERVASQFAERALRGDRGSLHPLFGVSNQAFRLGEPEMNNNDFSQALAWVAEPEWQGESSEAASETAAGSREPECFGEEC